MLSEYFKSYETYSHKVGEIHNVLITEESHDGNYLVGGNFTFYNGAPRKGILKLNTDGTIYGSFDIGNGIDGGSNPHVTTVVETSDGYYWVGGQFTTYDGLTHNNFVKLQSNGTAIW